MTRITLVRHASTKKPGDVRRLQGKTEKGLSELGIQQARDIARWAKEQCFVSVYSSPLKRCKQTSAIICESLQKDFTVVDDLRERDYGPYDGLSKNKLLEQRAALGLLNIDPTQDWRGVLDVESDEKVAARVIPFLYLLSEKHMSENVLLVTHAGVMKSVLFRVLKIEVGVNVLFQFPNTSYFTLRSVADFWHVVEISQGVISKNSSS